MRCLVILLLLSSTLLAQSQKSVVKDTADQLYADYKFLRDYINTNKLHLIKQEQTRIENLSLAYRTNDKVLAARVAEYTFLQNRDNPAVKDAYLNLTHVTTLVPYIYGHNLLGGQMVSAIRFTPDGKHYLVSIYGSMLYKINLETNALVESIKTGGVDIGPIDLSKDCRYFIRADSQNYSGLQLWDVPLKKVVGSLKAPGKFNILFINKATISDDNKYVVASTQEGITYLCE